jgi:hypothetical protein
MLIKKELENINGVSKAVGDAPTTPSGEESVSLIFLKSGQPLARPPLRNTLNKVSCLKKQYSAFKKTSSMFKINGVS